MHVESFSVISNYRLKHGAKTLHETSVLIGGNCQQLSGDWSEIENVWHLEL